MDKQKRKKLYKKIRCYTVISRKQLELLSDNKLKELWNLINSKLNYESLQ